jgi:hypothetical protein
LNFRNFAIKDGELTPSRQKKKPVSLFCTRFFVTLHAEMLSETMKQVVITIFLLCAAIGLQAQTAYEEIMKDIHKSAGYHYAYPGPSQAHLTPAPVGKKPFYLSHYG